MPKILIVFAGPYSDVLRAVAEGARAVRFSEVEVRRVSGAGDAPSTDVPALRGADELLPYDAIVFGWPSAVGEEHTSILSLLEDVRTVIPRTTLENKVGSAILAEEGASTAYAWPALAVLGGIGLLLVAPAGSDLAAATALGGRVAQVAGWVTHVRAHQHAH